MCVVVDTMLVITFIVLIFILVSIPILVKSWNKKQYEYTYLEIVFNDLWFIIFIFGVLVLIPGIILLILYLIVHYSPLLFEEIWSY